MALNKFFLFPFATTGTKSAVPDAVQVDGTVSYSEGYGADYSKSLTSDPDALAIERLKMNQLLYDVTTALREYQIFGTPDWITNAQNGGTAFSYGQGAKVRYTDGFVYESLSAANTALPTDPAYWVRIDGLITASRIASNAVTTAKILDANVTTAKIADSNVTTAKIADNNVTTVKILDANVTTAKIADSNVTTAKIADANVTNAKLSNMAANTVRVNNTASSAAPTDIALGASTILARLASGNIVAATIAQLISLFTGAATFPFQVIAPSFAPNSTSGIIGTTTNDNAAAGSVGEYISSSVAAGSAVSLTNNAVANVTSISLTAGDWELSGNVVTNPAGSTVTTILAGWISTVSATLPTFPNGGAYTQTMVSATAGSVGAAPITTTRLSLASTTTVYLSLVAAFSAGTLGGYGFIGARRVR